MKYLLDTDTLIYWLKGNKKIEEKALTIGLAHLGYTVISHAELCFGAYNSEQKEKNLQAIQIINQTLALVDFSVQSAQLFGKIKADLKQQGNIIMDADIMIAAVALSNNLTLVTNNEKHFNRIPDLKIENWVIN
jgi:tRNA(fMet)-specific endonuclease VapC